jgi:16S rRNA (guanine966-N2)-methyltransferase
VRIIAGRWRGRRIAAPAGERTRPTSERVREAWLSALQHDVVGATILDLFAGSGALGLEALSRGAAHATFVERAAGPLRALDSNISALGASALATVIRGDALRYIEGLAAGEFDIAFADPPYATDAARRLVEAFERVPFARVLCIEHPTRDRLTAGANARTRRYGDTALTFITAPE